MYEPHHSTCLQNSDLPSLTNRIASGVGMTQFSLNCLLFNNFFAPYIVNASPPSVRKVVTNLLWTLKFLILPVFLENSYWRSSSFKCSTHSNPEDSVNMTIYLICPVHDKGFKYHKKCIYVYIYLSYVYIVKVKIYIE